VPEAGNIARRYAAGIFQLAQEERRSIPWRAELAKLDELLGDDVLVAGVSEPAVGIKAPHGAGEAACTGTQAPETKNLAFAYWWNIIAPGNMHEIRQAFGASADDCRRHRAASVITAIDLDGDDPPALPSRHWSAQTGARSPYVHDLSGRCRGATIRSGSPCRRHRSDATGAAAQNY